MPQKKTTKKPSAKAATKNASETPGEPAHRGSSGLGLARSVTIRWPLVLLHGEKTTIAGLLFPWTAGGLAAASAFWWATVVVPMDLLRTIVLAVTAGDIATGFMTGLTSGTSRYYHANRRILWTVLALNVAPPAALWWLFPIGGEFWPTLCVYTLVGAVLIQAVKNAELQRLVAGLFLLVGSGETIAGAGIPGEAQFLSVAYMFKILFSFSLPHVKGETVNA